MWFLMQKPTYLYLDSKRQKNLYKLSLIFNPKNTTQHIKLHYTYLQFTVSKFYSFDQRLKFEELWLLLQYIQTNWQLHAQKDTFFSIFVKWKHFNFNIIHSIFEILFYFSSKLCWYTLRKHLPRTTHLQYILKSTP